MIIYNNLIKKKKLIDVRKNNVLEPTFFGSKLKKIWCKKNCKRKNLKKKIVKNKICLNN